MRPELEFNSLHGNNITLVRNGSRATVVGQYAPGGVVFSNRPISIDEVLCFQLTEIVSWECSPSKGLKFGVTRLAPSSHILMDINRKGSGHLLTDFRETSAWMDVLPNESVSLGDQVQFSVSQNGRLSYSVNGVDKGPLLGGIDISRPLWAVFDLFNGKAKSIELVTGDEIRTGNATISSQVIRGADMQSDLKFHAFKSRNIILDRHGTFASKIPYTPGGFCYSNRSISVRERVYIRLSAVQSKEYSLIGLNIGVTPISPQDYHFYDVQGNDIERRRRSRHICCSFWEGNLKVLPSSFVKEGDLVEFSVTYGGEIVYRIIGGKRGTLLSGINTSSPMYVIAEVCGTVGMIEFTDLHNPRNTTEERRQQLEILRRYERLAPPETDPTYERLPETVAEMKETTTDWLRQHEADRRNNSRGGTRRQMPETALDLKATMVRPAPPARQMPERLADAKEMMPELFRPSAPLENKRDVPTTAPGQDENSALIDKLCVFCRVAPRTTTMVPCGHRHYCYECAVSVQKRFGFCSTCRKKIDQVLKIYD